MGNQVIEKGAPVAGLGDGCIDAFEQALALLRQLGRKRNVACDVHAISATRKVEIDPETGKGANITAVGPSISILSLPPRGHFST
ncbi:hypothetical protein JCM30471_21470 [Desulfuromonas carbonis]